MTVPQRGDHELSRIYSEGAWPEPNRQIDDAILEASRRAARARHPVLHRWGPPFALAATVILGLSLALVVTDNESMREVRGLTRPQEPAVPGAAPQKKREAAPSASRPERAPQTETEPNVAAPPPRELFASPMGSGEAKPAAKAAAPAARAPAQAPPAALAKRPAAPPAAKSPAPPVARAAAPDPQRAERIRRDLEQLEENRETRGAVAASRPSDTPTSASVSDVRTLAAPAARSPEAWLDDIRKFKSEGRTADVERELADFRRRYPDYRVPDDLR